MKTKTMLKFMIGIVALSLCCSNAIGQEYIIDSLEYRDCRVNLYHTEKGDVAVGINAKQDKLWSSEASHKVLLVPECNVLLTIDDATLKYTFRKNWTFVESKMKAYEVGTDVLKPLWTLPLTKEFYYSMPIWCDNIPTNKDQFLLVADSVYLMDKKQGKILSCPQRSDSHGNKLDKANFVNNGDRLYCNDAKQLRCLDPHLNTVWAVAHDKGSSFCLYEYEGKLYLLNRAYSVGDRRLIYVGRPSVSIYDKKDGRLLKKISLSEQKDGVQEWKINENFTQIEVKFCKGKTETFEL